MFWFDAAFVEVLLNQASEGVCVLVKMVGIL